jgi:magnesium transporter
VNVRFVAHDVIEHHDLEDVPRLLERDDGFTWVDIGAWEPDAATVLSDCFRFHPIAVRDCLEHNRLPKLHLYSDHLFSVLHTPEAGAAGHVHYIELDQFVSARYLVTVHGPVDAEVDSDVACRATRAVSSRMEAGRIRPATANDLSHEIVSTMARQMQSFVETLTQSVSELERQVIGGHLGDPEQFLDDMFRARHALFAVGTIATTNGETCQRMVALARSHPSDSSPLLGDVIEQFEHVATLSSTQREYLQGIIEFYRTRADTKMTIAAERLAVIAVVTLPITALASIYGMNVIVNESTDVVQLVIVLIVMAAMSVLLLFWAKRQGWW